MGGSGMPMVTRWNQQSWPWTLHLAMFSGLGQHLLTLAMVESVQSSWTMAGSSALVTSATLNLVSSLLLMKLRLWFGSWMLVALWSRRTFWALKFLKEPRFEKFPPEVLLLLQLLGE